MAIIYQNPNGKIRGRLGPLYAKIVKGRNIFCIMPAPLGKYTEEMLEKLEHLRRFRTTAKLVANLNKIQELKILNEQNRGDKDTGWTALFSKNYPLSGIDYPVTANRVEVSGFGYDVTSFELTSSSLSATCPVISNYTELPAGAVNVTLAGAFVFTEPTVEGNEPFAVTSFVKDIAGYNFNSVYSLTHSLTSYQQRLFGSYQNKFAIFTLIIKDADGKILKNSSTISVASE